MENPEIKDETQVDSVITTAGQTTVMKTAPGLIHDIENKIVDSTDLIRTQPYQDIIDFLAKPIYLGNATMSTSSTRGSSLFDSDPDEYIDFATGKDMWVSKLKGFYSMKATFVYDVIINATPFHAGAVLMKFFPSSNVLTKSRNMHSLNLTTNSQHPGAVVCNINKDHHVVRIPYISTLEMFPLDVADAPGWGTFDISVWSPLAVGSSGSTTITLSVWGHWEDVVLGPVFPQSNSRFKSRNKNLKVSRKHPIESESNEAKGPISSMLSTVSVAADVLSDIPAISPIASTVSWASSLLSGVASAFGFSAPRTTVGPKLIVGGSLHSRNTNSDKFDPSVQLTTCNDGRVGLIEGKSIYEGDEMSFNFIKSRPAYLENFVYATSATVGQRIYSRALAPVFFRTPDTYDGQALQCYTPVGMLARSFYYYTGGFKLRIRMFKTAFHAGTLVFAYVPNSDATTFTLEQTSPLNRYVLDIQTEDVIEIELPYQAPQPFLSILESIGSLHVYAFTPLRAPETVSSSIDITVEVLGADDLTFANPALNGVVPLVPQGALEEVNEGSAFTIGATTDLDNPVDLSQLCIGEQIMSVKQLLNRYHIMHTNTSKAQFTASANFRVRTNLIGCAFRTFGAGNTFSDLYGTPLDMWSLCYAFRRGGTRMGLMREGVVTRQGIRSAFVGVSLGGSGDYIATGSTVFDLIPLTNTAGATSSAFWSPPVMRPAKEGGELLSAPYMSKYIVTPNEPCDPANIATSTRFQPESYFLVNSFDTTNDLSLVKSIDDNFQLKYFIGVPCVVDQGIA